MQHFARAGRNRPSDAPTGHQVCLRETVEGHDWNIRRQGRNRDVLLARIEDQLLVDFVGENHQAMLARQLENSFQDVLRIHRARRVIRIDQQNRPRTRVDLPLDVADVGLPVVVFVQIVIVDRAVQLAHDRAIKRIFRPRRQHVVAGVEERGDAAIDDLAAAVTDEDALDVAEALALGLLMDGINRGLDAQRIGVAVVTIAHGLEYRLDHVWRGWEVVLTRVTDVQVEDLVTFACYLVGRHSQIANGITHVRHARRGQNLGDLIGSHIRSFSSEGTFHYDALIAVAAAAFSPSWTSLPRSGL